MCYTDIRIVYLCQCSLRTFIVEIFTFIAGSYRFEYLPESFLTEHPFEFIKLTSATFSLYRSSTSLPEQRNDLFLRQLLPSIESMTFAFSLLSRKFILQQAFRYGANIFNFGHLYSAPIFQHVSTALDLFHIFGYYYHR